MNKYLITIHYEMTIKAKNENEAQYAFWDELKSGNRTPITEFAETMKIQKLNK